MEALTKRGYVDFTVLDSGGQGNVYKAFKNGKACAIKVTVVKDKEDFAKLDRDLRREIQITSKLRHPCTISVWDIFRTKTRVYTVMPLMAHGSIGKKVREEGPRCEWNAKSWFCSISRAVKYLHDNKVAHRDLKLDNVLLDEWDNARVCDFGLSRFVHLNEDGQVRLSTSFCGTRSHYSPQMIKKIPYNPYKCDIWCLGIMLFILINQVYPFDRREGPNTMYEKQVKKDYHLKKEIECKVSKEIKDLIGKLLEPEEAVRPDIWTVCQHPFFPIIHQEADEAVQKARHKLHLK